MWQCQECSAHYQLQGVQMQLVRPRARSRSRTPPWRGKGKCNDGIPPTQPRQYIGCRVLILQRPHPAPRGKTYGLAVGSIAVIIAFHVYEGDGYYTIRQNDEEQQVSLAQLGTHFRLME